MFITVLAAIAIQVGDEANHFSGEDSGHIVIDEIIGLALVGLFISQSLVGLIVAFVISLVDIIKPGRFVARAANRGRARHCIR